MFAQNAAIGSGVFHWKDLTVKKESQREGRKITEGTTHEFSYFEIHATTQEKGATPKPVHTQTDIEEVLIIKEGKMDAVIDGKRYELPKGGVLLIPPGVSQAVENSGDGPLTYYVFMFRSNMPMDTGRSNKAGGSLLISPDSLARVKTDTKATIKYFDRPTAMCENYEMHITELFQKGPSHAPLQHKDTEIILIIEGNMEMTIDGVTYSGTAGDMFIAESGKMHGVANASDKPCKYFAFKWR